MFAWRFDRLCAVAGSQSVYKGMYRILPLVLLSFCLPLAAVEPVVRFHRHQVSEGLSHLHVNAIMEDEKGFMWFGTDDGLNRFDGYEYRVFRHQPDNENSLSNSVVTSVAEDKGGNLWVGTEYGLNRYDPILERFTRFLPDGGPEGLPGEWITKVQIGKDGSVWATIKGAGLIRLVREKPVVYPYDPDNESGLAANRVFDLLEDDNGMWWLATDQGLSRFDPVAQTFQDFIISFCQIIENLFLNIIQRGIHLN